jgi:hypothetical protein
MDTFYNYFLDKNNTNNFNNSEIIKINTTLKNINMELGMYNTIKTPTLVIVGSQSSGKSTLINRILGIDIIPIGNTMETRTPINLELINTQTEYYIEFGKYENLIWNKTRKIVIDTNTENVSRIITDILEEIKFQTNSLAGEELAISEEEINIRFYSPNVPNLNFIDLPGITMIACTDRGQPKDIKDQIRNLLIKYISNPNNLIVCVMPAREDLETDIALELVKEYDVKGERTIGVLTKVDLMNINNDISNYILDNISKDLKLHYGYFAVKNKQNEMEFFNNHKVYSKIINKNKFGVKNLGIRLSEILIYKIKSNIPCILEKLDVLSKKNKSILLQLGGILPSNQESKCLIINKYISSISNGFLDNLENRYSKYNIGRFIKDIFVNYRKNIDDIKPFDNTINDILIEIIKNSDGNHMSMPLPTIEILEGCLLSPKINCYEELETISIKCLYKIKEQLFDLINKLLESEGISKYKGLYNKIRDDIFNGLINNNVENTKRFIIETISMEKSYIWTDNSSFIDLLKSIPNTFNSNEIDISILNNIISEYFNSIKQIIKHNIPKVIMYHLIRKIEKDINFYLLNKVQHEHYINYLVEDKELIDKRKKYTNIQMVLDNSKEILEKV